MPDDDVPPPTAWATWVLGADTLSKLVKELPILSGPEVDVEVLVGPRIRARAGEDQQQLRERIVRRGRKLLQPLRGASKPRVLLAIGDPEVEGQPEGLDATGLWTAALTGLTDDADRRIIVALTSPADPVLAAFARGQQAGETVVTAFGIAADSNSVRTPYAYVIVLALGAHSDDDAAQTFVREFAAQRQEAEDTEHADCIPVDTAPLFVIGVSVDGTQDTARWERLRASVVLVAGTGAHADITTAIRTPVDARQRTANVSFVPCPTFEAGVDAPGAARLRVDAIKGQAQIAFNYDLGHDLARPPVQVIRTLHSASRVSVGERRLYGHVIGLLDRELDRLGDDGQAVEALRASVVQTWTKTGYVQLCTEDTEDTLLADLPAVKTMSYLLLLVIRERQGGGYELLLSNHTPLRASRFGEWNTLLLPSFQFPATLLGHLRDDVLRQTTERVEDLERGDHATAFEEALDLILGTSELEEDVWADQVREVAGFTTRKLSPTSGVVTEYDYHFVTLLPFVERTTGTADETARAAKKLLAWFRDLDTVRDDHDPVDGVRGVSMAALREGGAAVRFEPSAELIADPDPVQRARAEKAPPGAMWFPLGAPGEMAPWRDVPAILARNADVMSQLDRVLKTQFNDGRLPPELLMSSAEPAAANYVVERTYTWSTPSADPDPSVPGTCTTDALAKVTFAKRSDLKGQLVYPPDSTFRRVYLLRRSVGLQRADRDAILVISAEAFATKDVEELTEDDALGRLRPVQRYVLKKGLQRVDELRPVFDRLAEEDNQWGFARVRQGDVGITVSVTPPIIEQLHVADLGEQSPRGAEEGRAVREFIVCDGTHRVVQQAWLEPAVPVPAILVDSQPSQPYYAHPFGSLEWDMTADPPLSTTPSLSAKYTPRRVTEADAPESWTKILKTPESSRFRRYYRNLEAGFGRLGGQGGRVA